MSADGERPARRTGPCSTKNWYASRQQAQRVLDTARVFRSEYGASRVETDVYRCPHCSGWHLTSRRTEGGRDSGVPYPAHALDGAKRRLRGAWGAR